MAKKKEKPRYLGVEEFTISERQGIATEQTRQDHIDPVIMKQREDHFADLAGVAKGLIDGLENVRRPASTRNKPPREVYLIPNENSASGYDEITKEQLSQRLNQNMKVITNDNKDRFFRSCFVPHVKNGLPEEMKTKLFLQIMEEQPLELIACLMPLAAGESFEGICPVCKDWYQPLTCPISCTTR